MALLDSVVYRVLVMTSTSDKLLAVIPARGGSKRIPRKNIKDFLGRPLISYSIDVALESGLFADVIVSTDDVEIAEVAKKCGATVPFMRDANLANDFAGTNEVMADALYKMKDLGKEYRGICLIYATAPLLTANHLKKAAQKFLSEEADYLYSCCEFPFPIQRGVYLNEEGRPVPVMPECMSMRSQDLPKAFQDAGQFYFGSHKFCDYMRLSKEEREKYDYSQIKARVYEMPRYRVIDIDTPEDWEYALILAEAIKRLNKE